MSEPFKKFRGTVAPLPRKDVDTDQIIAARFLTAVGREGFGANLFASLRESDPDFPLARPEFKGGTILLADNNFGCGSSREHAVWAIQDAGFKVVIAPSFADIFSSNAAKNGLLLVTLPQAVVSQLLANAKGLALTVDLEHQTVKSDDGAAFSFEYDQFRKHCLLHGLDDLDYILSQRDQIAKFNSESRGYFVEPLGRKD